MLETKFCEHCGEKIAIDAVICPKCGKQVEKLKTEQNSSPQVVINNTNNNNVGVGHNAQPKECDKWIAFLLCFFLGVFGAHKFYEEKIGLGILYIFTVGLFGIGWFIDVIVILCKPNPYYVY